MKSAVRTASIIVILVAIGGIFAAQKQTCDSIIVTLPDQTTITAEVADSAPERTKGLSRRNHLDADKGMLFLFSSAQNYSFWMKDTRIPLDIIWIYGQKVVDSVTLQPEAGDTIPRYTPKAPAQAVLEIPAGQAALHGVAIGQPITWKKCEA